MAHFAVVAFPHFPKSGQGSMGQRDATTVVVHQTNSLKLFSSKLVDGYYVQR